MKQGFAALAIVGTAATLGFLALNNEIYQTGSFFSNDALTKDDMNFIKYMSEYGKSYGTKEEFEFRNQ